ncbi:MAG: hypothetical protein AVDCRST_MAG75-2230, partial [uncultured Propionibacteriaceae bacterium]
GEVPAGAPGGVRGSLGRRGSGSALSRWRCLSGPSPRRSRCPARGLVDAQV